MATSDPKDDAAKKKPDPLYAGPGAVLDAAAWLVKQVALPIPDFPKKKKKPEKKKE